MAGLLNSTATSGTGNVLPPGVTAVNANQQTAGQPVATNVPQGQSTVATPTPTSPGTALEWAQYNAYQKAYPNGPTAAYPGESLADINKNDAVNPGATAALNSWFTGKADPLPGGADDWSGALSASQLAAGGAPASDYATAQAYAPAPSATPQQSLKTSATPAPTPNTPSATPSATTPTTVPATAADIAADYASDFGRPPDPAGDQFWTNALAQNPGMTAAQLNQQIEQGAQTQDQAAMSSLNGAGNTTINWNPSLNTSGVQPQNVVWNAQTGAWQNATTPNTPTPAAPSPAPGSAPATLPTATSQGYTATMDNVGPQSTVAGQLAQDLNPNSPLMVEAATQGNEQSNARGLLNSSIGISAAQQAMINAGLPIAQSDASTFAQAGLANQSAANTAASFTAGASNQAALANLSTATQSLLQSMQDSTTLATSKLSADTQMAVAQLNSSTQKTIQGMVNSNQQLLQTSTSAANTFNSAMNNIATIQQSTTMDATAKQDAVDAIITQLQNFMSAQSSVAGAGGVGDLNLSQYFPSPAPAPVPTPITAPVGSGSGGA